MTTLSLFFKADGSTNGATLESYTTSGERYFRKYLKPQTALTPHCPDIFHEYRRNDTTFIDYLTAHNLLPSLDADGIIDAYNHWGEYAEESLSQYRLPVDDFFTFLDVITKVTPHHLKISRAVLSPVEIMKGDQ